jgi:hypothetical protein
LLLEVQVFGQRTLNRSGLFPPNYAFPVGLFAILKRSLAWNPLTLGRLLSGGLALGLALFYSNLLGVEKRSVLSFALVTSLLLTLLIISPFLTQYRKLVQGKSLSDSHHSSFLLLCSLLSLFVGIVFLLIALLYSRLISTLPANLIIVMVIYSVVSTLSFGIQDYLPIIGRVRVSIFSDVLLVTLQIFLFFFLTSINQLSIIVSVLLSLIFSYTLNVFSISSIILFHQKIQDLVQSLRDLMQGIRFFFASGAIHVADRIDKIAIAFLLPISNLAQFTTMTAFFIPIRIIFEGAIRQLYFQRQNIVRKKMKMRTGANLVTFSLLLVFFVVFLFLVATSVNFLIDLLLGDEWLLPLYVVGLYFVYELVRGFFIYVTHNRIRLDDYQYSNKAPVLLLFLSLVLTPFGIVYFGLAGGVMCMITSLVLTLVGFKLTHAI